MIKIVLVFILMVSCINNEGGIHISSNTIGTNNTKDNTQATLGNTEDTSNNNSSTENQDTENTTSDESTDGVNTSTTTTHIFDFEDNSFDQFFDSSIIYSNAIFSQTETFPTNNSNALACGYHGSYIYSYFNCRQTSLTTYNLPITIEFDFVIRNMWYTGSALY